MLIVRSRVTEIWSKTSLELRTPLGGISMNGSRTVSPKSLASVVLPELAGPTIAKDRSAQQWSSRPQAA